MADQLTDLNVAYTVMVQKIRQTSLMAFGGPLNTGARIKTVRTAVELNGLAAEGYYEYRGVQPDGRYTNQLNTVSGVPVAYSLTMSYRLVRKEDLNRSYPSAGGGWFGMERLPDAVAALVPPMGFRDINALSEVSFGPADPGAKGKRGKPTDKSAIPHLVWPGALDARNLAASDPDRALAIPLGYIDETNTFVDHYAVDREAFDVQIDAYLTYFEQLGYTSLRQFDGRQVAKNAKAWETVKTVGAVVQVVGTLLKLVPIPPVQVVGQVLEIAGYITVAVASMALAGDIFESSSASDILSDAAYVSLQAYSLMSTTLEVAAPDEVQAVIDELSAAAQSYQDGGDPEAWLELFPADVQAAAKSWLECLSPNPAISNRNANAILMGTGEYALTGSKLGAIPDAPLLMLGVTEDGTPIPLPAMGAFPLPGGSELVGINSGFAAPKASAPDGAVLVGLAGVGALIYMMGR